MIAMIGGNMDYYIFMAIGGVMSLIGMAVSGQLKAKAAKYGAIPLRKGYTGKQIAEMMLAHYNVGGVTIMEGQGFLTDHYNPLRKVVKLSPDIHNGRSIFAAAVAAHECGHAIQHDRSYFPLQARSALVPIVNFSAQAQQWVLIGAFMALGSGFNWVMLIAIALFGVTALFSFVTLPVEFDASRRALAWLESSGVSEGEELAGAKDSLKWAAMTYVAAALSALVMVLYLILKYRGGRR